MWTQALRPFGIEDAGARLHRLGAVLMERSTGTAYQQMLARWAFPDRVVSGAGGLATPFSDEDYVNVTSSEIEAMMLIDSATYLPDDILVKVDRASMAVSLEARCPILDYRIFEFAWRLPLELKRRNGEGKAILKDLAYGLVPRELLDRPKSGFAIPIAAWLRGPLREWAEDLLSPERLRREGWLDANEVSSALHRHLNGFDSAASLWTALMFESWLETYRSPVPCSMESTAALQ
jgi:asparagine synthase (glutamine-hydrolysing)